MLTQHVLMDARDLQLFDVIDGKVAFVIEFGVKIWRPYPDHEETGIRVQLGSPRLAAEASGVETFPILLGPDWYDVEQRDFRLGESLIVERGDLMAIADVRVERGLFEAMKDAYETKSL